MALFNCRVYVASNRRMMCEIERICQEALVAYCVVKFNASFRIAGFRLGIKSVISRI